MKLSQRLQRPELLYRLPPAAAGRADFFLVPTQRHVLLVPASSRGAWFLRASSLADPPRLIPCIGTARVLRADYAQALLPLLAEHFRLRPCISQINPSTSTSTS